MTSQSKTHAALVKRPTLSKDGCTMTVHVPVTFRQQGGRKQIVTPPDASPWLKPAARIDSTLVKAIVRAHRWRDMLEAGRYSTVRELAKSENINESYLSRVLRLTLLSPAIVEAILEGRQPAWLEIDDLLKPIPIEWPRQVASWKIAKATSALCQEQTFNPKTQISSGASGALL